MENMSRDDFILQMIAELERQRDTDIDAFLKPKMLSQALIFRKLCFDFPIVSPEELEALGKGLSDLTDEITSDDDLSSKFTLDHKFLENIVFMSGSTGGSDAEETVRSEKAASICATLFLKLPKCIISSSRVKIGKIFRDRAIAFMDIDEFERLPSTKVSPLPWLDICRRFHSLVLRGTASIIAGSGADALVRGGYIANLSDLVLALNPFVTDRPSPHTTTSKKSETLGQFLQCLWSHHGSRGDSVPSEPTAHGLSDEDVEKVVSLMREVWVHLVLLGRDLMTQFPELVVLGLPSLCSSLMQGQYITSGGALTPVGAIDPTDFPVASECLFAVILASVAASVAPPSHSSFHHHNNRSSAKAGGGTALGDEVSSGDASEGGASKWSHRQSQARRVLRSYVDPRLGVFVDVALRMRTHAGDSGCEAVGLACDVAGLYLYPEQPPTPRLTTGTAAPAFGAGSEMSSMGVGGVGAVGVVDVLVENWLLPMLLQWWVRAVGGAEGHVERSVVPTAARVTQFLARLSLQDPKAVEFMTRFANFQASLLTLVAAAAAAATAKDKGKNKCDSDGDGNSNGDGNSTSSSPSSLLDATALLPLLVGLCAYTQPTLKPTNALATTNASLVGGSGAKPIVTATLSYKKPKAGIKIKAPSGTPNVGLSVNMSTDAGAGSGVSQAPSSEDRKDGGGDGSPSGDPVWDALTTCLGTVLGEVKAATDAFVAAAAQARTNSSTNGSNSGSRSNDEITPPGVVDGNQAINGANLEDEVAISRTTRELDVDENVQGEVAGAKIEVENEGVVAGDAVGHEEVDEEVHVDRVREPRLEGRLFEALHALCVAVVAAPGAAGSEGTALRAVCSNRPPGRHTFKMFAQGLLVQANAVRSTGAGALHQDGPLGDTEEAAGAAALAPWDNLKRYAKAMLALVDGFESSKVD